MVYKTLHRNLPMKQQHHPHGDESRCSENVSRSCSTNVTNINRW